MIASIRGLLQEKTPEAAVVDVGGVGYRVFITLPTFYDLPEPGSLTSLHIYTVMRDSAIQLFGFLSRDERSMFVHLLAVSGVGPKLARNILSGIQHLELRSAIMSEDLYRITAVPGVGKKTAERLIVDLRDRLSKEALQAPQEPEATPELSDLRSDVLSALVNLGYQKEAARRIVDRAIRDNPGADTLEAILRESLKQISSK